MRWPLIICAITRQTNYNSVLPIPNLNREYTLPAQIETSSLLWGMSTALYSSLSIKAEKYVRWTGVNAVAELYIKKTKPIMIPYQ